MHIFYYLLKIWKLWWHIAGVCLLLLPSARASTPPLAIALNTVPSLPPQVGSRPIWALEIFMFWFLDLNLSQSQEDNKGSRNVHDGHEEPPTIKMAQVTEEVQSWKRLQKVFSHLIITDEQTRGRWVKHWTEQRLDHLMPDVGLVPPTEWLPEPAS